jgi:ATP-binding protein involved in chromosome partitioning
MPTRDEVTAALRNVMDPELGRDIVSLGMVKDVEVSGGDVRLTVELTTPACPLRNVIQKNVEEAVRGVAGVTSVAVAMGARVTARVKEKGERLPTVKNVIAVGAGKGGVGKSTVALNLALALAKSGARVGLLDADIYGPSIPMMLGLEGRQPSVVEKDGHEVMVPIETLGIKVFSMGLLLRAEDAVVWRGPMLHKALTQFLEDVEWGDLDYLVVDLPPGTGDVQISMANLVPISSAIVVTTPQDVSFADVRRAVRMFEVTKVPVMGLIENMASFVCTNCGTEHHIFGKGHIRELAEAASLPYLGSLPLDPDVSPRSDEGLPIVIASPDGASARALIELAGIVAGRQSVMNAPASPD